jgi:WD40 repeat protein
VVVSGGADAKVRVWDATTGEANNEFAGDAGAVLAVAVGQVDGRTVTVSGGADATVRVWDGTSSTVVGLAAGVNAVAITPHPTQIRIAVGTDLGIVALSLPS